MSPSPAEEGREREAIMDDIRFAIGCGWSVVGFLEDVVRALEQHAGVNARALLSDMDWASLDYLRSEREKQEDEIASRLRDATGGEAGSGSVADGEREREARE